MNAKAKVLTKLAQKWRDATLIREFALAFAKASSQLCRTEAGKREAESFFCERDGVCRFSGSTKFRSKRHHAA